MTGFSYGGEHGATYDGEPGATYGFELFAVGDLAVAVQGPTEARLTWGDPNNNAGGYAIDRQKRYDNSWGPWRDVDEIRGDREIYTDDGISPDRKYRWRVRAVSDGGERTSGLVVAESEAVDVRQTNVPTNGWYVEVDHPNADSPLTPSVIADDIEFPHQANALPLVRIPVPKAEHWLRDQQLEDQPMRVWKDGKRLPIGRLENVREQPDRVILEGRGGLALTQRVQQEYVEREAQLGAKDIIEATGLAADVDDPSTSVTPRDRMQSADTTDEFLDRLGATDGPAEWATVADGALQNRQAAFFVEAENADTQHRVSEQFTDSYSNGAAVITNEDVELNGTWAEASHTFTTDYTIPAADASLGIRLQLVDENNHGFELQIDGETVLAVGPDAYTGFGTDFFWEDATGVSADLDPGEHEVTFIVNQESPSTNANMVIDCLTFWDGRFSPGWGNAVTDGVLDGDLYPKIMQETTDATTFQSIVAGELTSAWNDTSGDQAVAISNDLGQNWIEASNSEHVSGEFAEGSAQIRARFTLLGYDPDPSSSPAGRTVPHSVDHFDSFASLDDRPLLINKLYDGQAIEHLQSIADYADAMFAVEWDQDVGGYEVVWTWPGLRSRETSASLVDYETAKLNEDSYERVVIKGQSRRVDEEPIAPDSSYSLDYSQLVEGTGNVADPDAGTVYTEGEDYELNRLAGEITILDSGNMTSGDNYTISYDWKITGEYEPPDAPENPKTLVRSVPQIPTSRGADQAALYLYRVVDEPLIEAQATLDEIPAEASIVETITIPDLPTGGEAVELREIQQSAESPTIVLGSRQGLGEAIQEIQSQLKAVNKLV